MSQRRALNEALALLQQGAFTSARAICQQRLLQEPNDFNARHLLGVIQLRAGNAIGACRELQRASTLDVAPRYRAQALSNLALALQQRNKLDDALSALEQAIELSPDEPAFHLNVLALLEQLERWPALLEHAQRHAFLLSDPDAQLLLARAERHLDRPEQAHTRLQPILMQGDTEVIGEWALASYRCGREVTLAHCCQTTAQWQAVADYLAEEGESEGALLLYRLLLEQEPDNASVRHLVDAAEGRIGAQAPEAYVRSLYDSHAGQFEQHLVQRLEYQAPRLLVERLSAHLPPRIETVADLGCGSGLLGIALREHFQIKQLMGCDLSAGMLEQARQRNCYDVLEQQELQRWLAQHRGLQLIGAADVLIYSGDLTPVLRHAHAALSGGGWFAFTVEEAADGDVPLRLARSGRYQHSVQHIDQVTQATGFEPLLCERFPLRKEQGKMLTGLMVLLHKPQTGAN